jgi:aryl-alcohol dehydrogenase-like predicted oxidoreductase
MAQLALSWCLRKSNVSSVIIGATRLEQLDDNAKCSGIEIPPEALAIIDDLFPGLGDRG